MSDTKNSSITHIVMGQVSPFIGWLIGITIIAVMIVVLTNVNIADNEKRRLTIERLIQDGADPISARCAIYGLSIEPACIVAAVKSGARFEVNKNVSENKYIK